MYVGVVNAYRRATQSDAAEVGHVLAVGFSEDPVLSWVFDEPRRLQKLEAFFGFLADEALVPLGATFLVPGAVACWTPPDTPEWPAERGARFEALLQQVCTTDELSRLGALDAATQASHPAEPHWFLGSIATVPERRGHGLGTVLMDAALEVVDRDGLPAYLESTNPRNVAFYRRFGFEVRDRLALEPSGPPITTMWRPAARGPR